MQFCIANNIDNMTSQMNASEKLETFLIFCDQYLEFLCNITHKSIQKLKETLL